MANSLILTSRANQLLFSTKQSRKGAIVPLHPSISFRSATLRTAAINVDYCEQEFGSDGVRFSEIGESCVISMTVENGSAAKMMLPSGLITSYKPRLWHGGSQELLHTCVEEADRVSVKGGVSLACHCSQQGFSWSPTTWALKDVRGDAIEGIKVEIVSREANNEVEVQHIISLGHDSLCSEFKVCNLGSSMLEVSGSVISHLTVSTPDATYAIGLEGSNFRDRPPVKSHFSIIPDKERGKETGEEGEENNNYKHLSERMSRIYTSAPRMFTIIDRGKRNSVDVGRRGFEEVYMYSPGSSYEWYGKYAYVCVGQALMLNPIRLPPGDIWGGEQLLHNPNI